MVKMERALMIWLEDCIAKKIPISGNLIKQKAFKIYEHLRNIGHSYAKDEEELIELTDVPTANALVNENKENEWVPNLDLQDVKKGLNLAKELELHFIQTDHPTVRRAKFKRELRNCLAFYREVSVELEKKATIENQWEDEPSEEDILPIKRRGVRRLISDSEDEC
ncbi:tigger transposable element-derived protein 1 [Trichonephila clavata]|uniref:Tigger transposable element-derived protein 1 n=1 Tax=Trichonephila clavata TaxID=2740835 RepID=A0A8X6FU65_TRICU|nr:tigger transposable element-derived protein 1 [Trichonephila clavata]